jgi:hypothetical protein
MRSQKLKHRFPPFQQVGSGIVIHASLSRVESIQPILLSGTLVRVKERLHEAVPGEYRWTS